MSAPNTYMVAGTRLSLDEIQKVKRMTDLTCKTTLSSGCSSNQRRKPDKEIRESKDTLPNKKA